MKKLSIWGGIVLVILVVGMFFIRQQKVDTDITSKQTKVGMVLIGEKEDHSWGQSHYEGMEKSAKELNLLVEYEECVPENEECIQVMEEMIEDGCKIICCNSFGYGPYIEEVAQRHPDIYFFHATGVTTAHNLSTYFGRIYQMRYLSGIVAGLQTKTNELGYVAAFNMSEVNRGINAFTLGAKSVNPDITVHVSFINSWLDDEKTEEITNELLEAHPEIDVIAMHTDSLKALEIAEERGIWSIGYNVDNSKLFPNTFLTAPVWNWDSFYTPYILSCLQGKFTQNNYWLGAETGVVRLAPLTDNVNPKAKGAVEDAYLKLKSGSFDVFYGPIKDNTGVIRVEAGECMADETLLNEFDWFVEGVEIDE